MPAIRVRQVIEVECGQTANPPDIENKRIATFEPVAARWQIEEQVVFAIATDLNELGLAYDPFQRQELALGR